MFKVVVADDEKISREGIRDLIDWPSLGLELAFSARDGEEALEYITQNPIDILLTDVRMPRMDGLELIHAMENLEDVPTSLILSGYDDFRYAQQAIQFGVVNYLLKPVRPAELIDAIKTAKQIRSLQKKISPFRTESSSDDMPTLYAVNRVASLISEAVCRGDKAEAKEHCLQLKKLYLSTGYHGDFFRRHAFRVIYRAVHSAEDFLGVMLVDYSNLETLNLLSIADNCEDIYHYLIVNILSICDKVNEDSGDYKKRIIYDVCRIVQEKYSDENLSVSYLADRVGVTPNYLSSLFHKEMGSLLSGYLENRRMQQAKIYLQDTGLRVYEVAHSVGYADSRHFGRVFKQNFGCSPLSYRNTFGKKKKWL